MPENNKTYIVPNPEDVPDNPLGYIKYRTTRQILSGYPDEMARPPKLIMEWYGNTQQILSGYPDMNIYIDSAPIPEVLTEMCRCCIDNRLVSKSELIKLIMSV